MILHARESKSTQQSTQHGTERNNIAQHPVPHRTAGHDKAGQGSARCCAAELALRCTAELALRCAAGRG